MFSGIVHGMVPVAALKRREGGLTFTLDLGAYADGLARGASVSVAGTCMTATDIVGGSVSFDAMGETLAKTTLGDLKEGDRVNVERSVRVGDEIGGHRVSGHVTGTAEIAAVETAAGNRVLTMRHDPAWSDCILPKGFIALDGCSLTVVDVRPGSFTVHLIPETLRVTTFGVKKEGDRVNLELDPETVAIVETVKRVIERSLGR